MTPPRDYPIDSTDSPADEPSQAPLTFAALRARHDAQLPITEEMIREARVQMETAEPSPYSHTTADPLETSNES